MGFHYFAGAAYRALTARKDGPSLYDVCDPLLLDYRGGDPHLGKFYRTALGNPALRPLLRRTGLPQLRDERRMTRLRDALTRARAGTERTIEALTSDQTLELAAMDLRIATNAVGEIVGKTTTEDLLDSIFSQFCIGK